MAGLFNWMAAIGAKQAESASARGAAPTSSVQAAGASTAGHDGAAESANDRTS